MTPLATEQNPRLRDSSGIWSKVFDYHPFEPVLARAEGVYLYDEDGRRYLDGSGGAMSVNIGHGDPRIREAMARQSERFSYCHPLLSNRPRAELCERISQKAPGNLNVTFLASGGSEAIETAIKLARHYHVLEGRTQKHIVISRRESYHGMSLGALAASGLPGMRSPFTPMINAWEHIGQPSELSCPAGLTPAAFAEQCARQLEEAIYYAGADQVAAFMATPLGQGEDYAFVPPREYWKTIREICDRYGILLIADEVVTGWGRTGRWFGMEHYGVQPDILVTAKGISGCYAPLAAVTVSDAVNEPFRNGGFFPHAYTFGGNPVSCAAGLAAIDILEKDGLVERAAESGEYLRSYKDRFLGCPLIADVRGQGMLTVLELVSDRKTRAFFPPSAQAELRFRSLALRNGLALFGLPYGPPRPRGRSRGLPVFLAPPLCITHAQIDELAAMLMRTLEQLQAELQELSVI